MKRKPIVAVVGRPNVGKSTFVNRLVGKRQSIVDDLPGVTRDRIYFDVEWQNKQFTVIDTGETFYQIKLGNNAIALGDFEKINTIGEN